MTSASSDTAAEGGGATSAAAPSLRAGDALFGKFVIPADSIFYRSPGGSIAFVNLRPIVPGHVLVIPGQHICTKMADLSEEEYLDLWLTVRKVQSILKKHYTNTACNVAVQDGNAAGQSVPHVHVHILPRSEGDFERNDDIYDALQEWAPRPRTEPVQRLEVPDDGDRRDRTREQMAQEAAIYRKIGDEENA